MRAWFQRFMYGRYGTDQFSRFLSIAALVLLVFSFLLRPFYYIGFVLMIYSYFRVFSRNFYARQQENQRFLQLRYKATGWFSKMKKRFDQRKVYRYFSCPHCRQELRVPKGRGKISINCPKCGTQFIRKS